MNYEAFFNNCKHWGIPFGTAVNLLSVLLNCTSEFENKLLSDQVYAYQYVI